MTEAIANSNFSSLSGVSVHNREDTAYKQYRNCWMEYPRNFTLRDFPMHLDIEITSRCNLKCPFCDKAGIMAAKDMGDMEFRLYKKIIDEGAARGLWAVKLNYRGEPLLHKDVARMVSYAKEKGILDVYFNTNGMLLSRDMCRALIDAGLDRISLSVDGSDPVEFEKKRPGADFKVILGNIKTLLALRGQEKTGYPKVRVQTVNFPGMDLENYKDFWKEHCDEVAAVDYKDGARRQKGITGDWACPQLWQRMTVRWDGMVSPCNNDDPALLSVGNVKDRSIYDCWHDTLAQEARVLHRRGESHRVEACDGCPWRTAQINKLNIKK